MTQAWRQFELLVARIEAALSPMGAKIVSPDKVPDRITGNMREVDATIRFAVDGRETLVTVECRDRQSLQDVTWIEQLVTKRDSIGADATIAVSSRGFSEPALRKASHFGIRTRVTRELEPSEVLQVLKLQVHEACLRVNILHMNVRVHADMSPPAAPPALAENVMEALRANAGTALVFHRPPRNPMCWNDLWSRHLSLDRDEIVAGVPSDGTSKQLRLVTNFSDDVFVESVAGLVKVGAVEADLELSLEHHWARMSADRATEYADDTTPLAQSVVYSAATSFDVQITTVHPVGSGQPMLTVQLSRRRGT